MTYPRLCRYITFLSLTGMVLGMGPAAFAQTTDVAPLPSRTVLVALPDVPLLPARDRSSVNPWQAELPTGLFVNHLPVPRTLNILYHGRCCWTADEFLAQIPLGHIRCVQRLSPAAFQATYGPSSLGAEGAWFIQVSGERQLLKALRRDGSVPFPRRRNKRPHCI